MASKKYILPHTVPVGQLGAASLHGPDSVSPEVTAKLLATHLKQFTPEAGDVVLAVGKRLQVLCHPDFSTGLLESPHGVVGGLLPSERMSREQNPQDVF